MVGIRESHGAASGGGDLGTRRGLYPHLGVTSEIPSTQLWPPHLGGIKGVESESWSRS